MQPERNRVVVHRSDGGVLKGYTHDFYPEKDTFHLIQPGDRGDEAIEELKVSALKAIFFVKSLEGNKAYDEKKDFGPEGGSHGIKIKVVFKDGEVMRGFSLGYNKTKKGFFIIPMDPMSNNERIYIVAVSAAKVTVGPEAEK